MIEQKIINNINRELSIGNNIYFFITPSYIIIEGGYYTLNILVHYNKHLIRFRSDIDEYKKDDIVREKYNYINILYPFLYEFEDKTRIHVHYSPDEIKDSFITSLFREKTLEYILSDSYMNE